MMKHADNLEGRSIRLSETLCAAAERQFPAFENVEALITFLLEQMLVTDTTELDQQELALIQRRLKDLGYV